MNCHEIEDLISDYIEDELPETEALKIKAHLEECQSCLKLKEKIEEMMYSFPELEEEVPFFLRNRLYYIPESQEIEDLKHTRFGYMKYVAAVVGTFVLLLNLFYFTNIYPAANRALHGLVARIKTITVDTGAFFEKVKDSRGLVLAATFDADDNGDPDRLFLDSADETRNDTDPIDIKENWDKNMDGNLDKNLDKSLDENLNENLNKNLNKNKDTDMKPNTTNKKKFNNDSDANKSEQNVTSDGGKND